MRTYTEAQYSTPSAMQMILDKFIGERRDEESIEAAARYMNRTLRIGGIRVCRALVRGALNWETTAGEVAKSDESPAYLKRAK